MIDFFSASLFRFRSHADSAAREPSRKRAGGGRSIKSRLKRRKLVGEALEHRRVLAAYLVTTADDVVAEDGLVSLREAINASNSIPVVNSDTTAGDTGSDTVDTIGFAEGLSMISLGSELVINDSLRITLGDASMQAISGNDASRIFSINGGEDSAVTTMVSIEGLTLSDGLAERGGAIFVSSGQSLSMDAVTLSGNTATGDAATEGGGAIYSDGGSVTILNSTISGNVASGTAGSGGGILNLGGSLTITDSIITGNAANRAGGGIETAGGSVEMTNVTLGTEGSGNSVAENPAPGNGGGLHIGGAGVVNITDGSVVGNAAVEGGGLWNSGSGTLVVDGTTISGNTAVRGGGVYQDEAGDTQTFTVDLQTLNAAYGSTAQGSATITLDTSGVTGPDTGVATIRVEINADGLQDLSTTTGGIHVAHIHGQFAGNASKPLAEQGGGSFFSGEGGVAADSITPTTQDDGAKNIDETADPINAATDYLDFFEGRPDYGPVVLNLTKAQLAPAPDGTGPLTFFFQQLAAGNIPADAFPNATEFIRDTTYTFDLSDADARRQYRNLSPLESREIVIHGLTVPTAISDAIDAATNAAPGSPTAGIPLGDGMSFRRTAPVAAGEIVRASGSTMLSNVIITDNSATGDDATDGGAGVYNANSVVVTDSQITMNVADGVAGSGGGVFNAGVFTASNTDISGNTANRAGGGLEATNSSTTTLINVNLIGNIAGPAGSAAPGNGGGMHISGAGNATITGGIIEENLAAREGGGLWNGNGTMVVSGTNLIGNVASGDAADDGGGGLFNDGGDLQISNAIIDGNVASGTAGSGGGILNLGGSLTITDSIITGNAANRAGGGIETAGGSVEMTNVTLGTEGSGNSVAENPAPGNGGGLHIGGAGVVNITDGSVVGNAAVEGGGLWNSGSGTLVVDGTTISGNTAVRGGGVYQDEAGDTQTFTVDLQTLNAAYGSTAKGSATITLDTSGVTGPDTGVATIRVEINADGLQDLSTTTGGIHVAHIHGQFAGNASKPLAEQGDGSFFSGEGGVAADSITPTTQDDGAKNIDETAAPINAATDYLDFFEGRPDYGPVVLNLTKAQLAPAPDGTGPLTFFFQQLAAGNIPADAFPNATEFIRDTTYTFDLSDADARRQYRNLSPLESREIVIHGLTVPTAISDAIDAATNAAPGSPTAGIPLGDGMSFRRTAPVAAGEIVRASGSTMLSNVIITDNSATGDDATDGGAGVYNANSVVVTDSQITMNVADGVAGSGGGVFNAGVFTASNTDISGNTANRAGGGLEVVSGSTTTIVRSNLNENVAGPVGSAAPGNGGAVHITGDGSVSITETTIDSNAAANEGGGLWNSAAGLLEVVRSTLSGNTSGDGGGIFNDGSGGDIIVTNSTIAGNTATGLGGGIASEGASVMLTSVTIADNNAADGGGISVGGGNVMAINSIVSAQPRWNKRRLCRRDHRQRQQSHRCRCRPRRVGRQRRTDSNDRDLSQ